MLGTVFSSFANSESWDLNYLPFEGPTEPFPLMESPFRCGWVQWNMLILWWEVAPMIGSLQAEAVHVVTFFGNSHFGGSNIPFGRQSCLKSAVM